MTGRCRPLDTLVAIVSNVLFSPSRCQILPESSDTSKTAKEDAKRARSLDDGCYDVSKADFRFAGLFGYEAPWLPQCTGCAQKGDPECFDNPCWCIPDGGQDGCCPDPGGRPITYDWQVADAFMSYVEISEPIVFDPPGCDPWLINQELYPELVICNDFPEMNNLDAVCAFMYKEDDPNCGGLDPREYRLETFPSYDEAVTAGGVVTHYGCKWSDIKTLFRFRFGQVTNSVFCCVSQHAVSAAMPLISLL
jgi:hypothetical protein